MWELNCEESWVPKNWCFWTVVLEKTLESALDSKEIQPVHPKGDQSWVFIGRTDAEAETPTLWPPHAKSWLIGKDPDAGRNWAGGEGDDRGWDGWMASPTRWAWVWVNSGNLWWTGRPGVLRFMGSQRAGHDWATELNSTPVLSSEYVDAQCGNSPNLLRKEHFHPFHSLLLRKSGIFALLHPSVLFTSFPLSRKLSESLLIGLFFVLSMFINLFSLLALWQNFERECR